MLPSLSRMNDVEMTDAVDSLVSDPVQSPVAFSGWQVAEKIILYMLADGNPEKMKYLKQLVMSIYGGDISKALDNEEMAGFQIIVASCLLDPAERDAILLQRAIAIRDYDVIVEQVCTRSPEQFHSAKKAYQTRYKKAVEEDIAQLRGDTCRELLLPLVSTYGYSGLEVNERDAKNDAVMLREKITEGDYSNGDVIWFFASRSRAHVKATLDYYRRAHGNDICMDLEADPNNQFLHMLRTAVECLTFPEKYFGKVLHVAINAQMRDEWAIARVLSTKANVDMNLIIEECCRMNGPDLLPQRKELVALVPNL